MPRETASAAKVREEEEKTDIKVSTLVSVTFKGSEYEPDGPYGDYKATYDSATDVVTITAPCEEERSFRLSALIKLIEALEVCGC